MYPFICNTPVMYIDRDGNFPLLVTLAIIFGLSALTGVVGTFIGDIATSAITGEWSVSSWETYADSAIGYGVGAIAMTYFGPTAGLAISAGLSTFAGMTLEKATGTSNRSWGNIVLWTTVSLGVGASFKIAWIEALARYESPIHGHIPPSEFIPIVEKNRLIIAFGKKIIDLAIIFIKRLISLGINDCPVAINISTLQLLDGAFTTDLISRIERAGIPFNLVVVELTETIFTANYDQLNRALSELTNAGIGTAIDDFGTGFSSLARIEKLDFDTVKIDRSFIEPLTTKEAIEQSTIPEIISICKKFNIRSLAEGIETKDQYDLLKSLGCILGQGYYMSRPLETAAAVNYVLTDKKK